MGAPLPEGVRRRRVDVGTAELDVLEAGDPGAPLVVLAHGFPESSWSWRHQLAPLAAAGYHVLAPDQRGYGRSTRFERVEDYGIQHLTGDLLNLAASAGHADDAVYMGHDWGALIVWDLAKLHPNRCRGIVGLSVPFVNWPAPPTQLMKAAYGDRFFYILYFQRPHDAERELEADVRRSMHTVLWGASGEGFAPRGDPPPMEGTGFLTQSPTPPALPWPWLTEADLDQYTEEFSASGFFGPISYYRNLDANYSLVHTLGPERLTMPTAFVAGSKDPVLVMDPAGVERMAAALPAFRGATIIEGAGHWVQQEAPEATNRALVAFLDTLG